jgi:uncharacterized peroxidase-related enzyme
MITFKTHTLDTVPEGSKKILEAVNTKYKFIPNALAVYAESPTLLDSYVTLSAIFEKSSLNETERQIILMTNSIENACGYCTAAHTTISQMFDVPDDVIESVRAGKPINDPKLEALRKFSIIINKTRGWASAEQVEEFLNAGYSKQTILEVIVGTSIKVLSNYTNHIAEPQLDDAFASNAWIKNTPSDPGELAFRHILITNLIVTDFV